MPTPLEDLQTLVASEAFATVREEIERLSPLFFGFDGHAHIAGLAKIFPRVAQMGTLPPEPPTPPEEPEE